MDPLRGYVVSAARSDYDEAQSLDNGSSGGYRRHVATAEQIKALLRSYAVGDDEHFRAVAMQIAAHLARKGNSQIAGELRELIDKSRHPQAPVSSPRAVPIARPAGDLAGLDTGA